MILYHAAMRFMARTRARFQANSRVRARLEAMSGGFAT
jgi:hypothetical protein